MPAVSETAIVGIAGMAATLLGVLLGQVLQERGQRRTRLEDAAEAVIATP